MNGDHDDLVEVDKPDDDELAEDELANDELMDELEAPTENVGETSMEIDVEELIAELEADSGSSSDSQEADPRKRLEEILEERRAARELEEIDEFSLGLLE